LTWFYNNEVFTLDESDEYVGFVYLIENLINNRKYIGKKLFTSTRRTKVKGKTHRKKVVKQSDWLDYFGSNKELNEDVKNLGKENFKRTILHLCKSKGTANYYEAYEQIHHNVLTTDDFYNEHIYVRVHRSHIKT
jgi:hypothetical protein